MRARISADLTAWLAMLCYHRATCSAHLPQSDAGRTENAQSLAPGAADTPGHRRLAWAGCGRAAVGSRGPLAGAAILAVVAGLVAVLLVSRGAGPSRGAGSQIAQATATPAAINTPAPTPTATQAPFVGKVIRVVNTVPWLTGKVSVSCPAGTTLISGGVDNGYGTTDYAPVLSSYPSSPTTWSVIGPMSNVSYTLSAVADCLQSSTPVTTRIVKLTAPTSSYNTGGGPVEIYDARCPSGVVTGGGYDVNGGYIVGSHPDGANGWMSASARTGMTAYIICASAPIRERASHVTVTYPLYSGSGPDTPTMTTVSCPSGYLPLSGGFGEPQSSDIQIG